MTQQGPVTPDHVIRTKRIPLLGTDVAAYAAQYAAWFKESEPRAKERKTMLDPAPRLVLDQLPARARAPLARLPGGPADRGALGKGERSGLWR